MKIASIAISESPLDSRRHDPRRRRLMPENSTAFSPRKNAVGDSRKSRAFFARKNAQTPAR
jgi:hypothetical protein